MKYVTESIASELLESRREKYINEATSLVNDKLKSFIKDINAESQGDIKKTLNAVYTWISKKGMKYTEDGKATKGQLKDTFNKYGSRSTDQLTWRLKVECPDGIYTKFKTYGEFTGELQNIVKNNSVNYVITSTSNDLFYTNYTSDKNSSIGVCIKSGSYDSSKKATVFTLFFKVTAPHVEEVKSTENNDANHKKIYSLISSAVEGESKKEILKALDMIYGCLGGYIDGKRTLTKSGVLKYEGDNGRFSGEEDDVEVISWKVELLDDKTPLDKVIYGSEKLGNIVKSRLGSVYLYVDGDDYRGVKVGSDDYGIAITMDYGARGTRYLRIAVFKVNKDVTQKIDNPFADSKGMSLKNDKVAISYDRASKKIRGADLTDMMNEPRFYTDKKKGIEEAWENLLKEFNKDTDFSSAMRIIDRTSSTDMYYAMD